MFSCILAQATNQPHVGGLLDCGVPWTWVVRLPCAHERLVGGLGFEKLRATTLNNPISVGHTSSMVKVELMWSKTTVFLLSLCEDSQPIHWILLMVPKVAQCKIIIHIGFLEKNNWCGPC